MTQATGDERHAVVPATSALPSPQQLAAVGTVLCMYRSQAGGELAGWSQGVRAAANASIDSDGPLASVLFYDNSGECCWRLYLLPDSDFLAWERLLAALPESGDPHAHTGIGERLWRRLAGRVRSGPWQSSVLRLHALYPGPGFADARQSVLAACLAPVSTIGAVVARRIARNEGADSEAFVEQCCCRQAIAAAALAARAAQRGEYVFSLIQLNYRATA